MESVPPRTNRTGKLSRQQTGTDYEQRARCYLEQAGLKFVAANLRFRGGELDLVMREGTCWVFVEVRYRQDARFGGAAASVTRAKQQKLLRAAASWLAMQQGSFAVSDCRFDVVAITGDQLEWLTNAFSG